VLWPLIAPTADPSDVVTRPAPATPKSGKQPANEAEFFALHSHDKPADNVKLITGYLYARYGSDPFALSEVRALATRVGITAHTR